MDVTLGFIAQLAKLSQPVWFALAIATAVVLFAPPELAETLGIDRIRAEHTAVVGLTFVVSTSLSLVSAGQALLRFARFLLRRVELKRQRSGYLRSLTPAERAYLIPFIRDDENTQLWPMDDGVAGGLLRKRIVYRSSNAFNVLDGVPYNLQPWAREALQEQPELLDSYDPHLYPRRSNDPWRI